MFGGEEGGKYRKEREKGEIVGNQEHFICFVKSNTCGCMMLFAQPMDSISNSEEIVLFGI